MIPFTETKQFVGKVITAFVFMFVAFVLPVLTYAQTITLSSSNPAIPAAYIAQSSTKQPIYRAVIQITGGTNFNSLTFTATGTYAVSDIDRTNNNFGCQVWMNTTDNLSSAYAISNLFDAQPSGSQVSININNPYLSDNTYYIWVTADIHPNAIAGHTLTVSALTIADFTFKKGSKSGTLYGGGTQTIIASGSNIYLDRSSLWGFSYIEGYGPSAFQYYVVNGTGLIGNVTITTPSHFEVSLSSGSGYSSSLSLSPSGGILNFTTVYVRLKAGLTINTYNSESIVHISSNATTKNVSCSGAVTCDLDPPIVTSPITYCQNETASPLTANGTDLFWIQTGSSSVGGTTDPTQSVNSDNSWNNKTTSFTVSTNVSTVTINSVNWFVQRWQDVTGVLVAIQNADGTPVTNGTQTDAAITLTGVAYDRKQISTFSNLVLTPGNYRIGLAAGSGRFGYINPGYPQTEPTGSINITGNNGNQLYYNLQFNYYNQSSIAPTPNTSAVGSTYYYVTQTVAGCTSGPATIEVIVVSGGANMTVTAASSSPTTCINTAMTNITHTTTGATGISNDGISGANGLPSGVSAHWASNTITISGTPSASGTFNYSIPLTGGCGSVSATGTITVTPNNTAGSSSSNPTLCINTALSPNITIATTGATGIGTPTGLPSGMSVVWASNTITISGTPSASGTFNYSIPLTGGCGSVNATGIITVTPTVGTPTAITVSAGTEPTCQLTNGTTTTTYYTTSTNNTGFNWSRSNSAAGSIGATTGVMTWANGFSGSVDIQVTANGCNGPSAQVTRSVTVITLINAYVELVSSSPACPQLDLGFNPDNDNHQLGETEVIFKVTRLNSTANWSFNYQVTVTNSVVSINSPKPASGSFSGSGSQVLLNFYINNLENTPIDVSFDVTNVTDSNCTEISTSDNHASLHINPMPAVGPFE
jgi:hypothetical protein